MMCQRKAPLSLTVCCWWQQTCTAAQLPSWPLVILVVWVDPDSPGGLDCQARPGGLVTLMLAAAGLSAIGGGALTCALLMLLLWLLLRHGAAPSGDGGTSSAPGAHSLPDDASSVEPAGHSDASSGAPCSIMVFHKGSVAKVAEA